MVVVCAVGAAGLYWLGALLSADCVVRPDSEAVSPTGEWRAVVYARDCGATTSAATHVSIVPHRDGAPREPGNVLVADHDHRPVPADAVGGPRVTVTWIGADRLRVVRPPHARVFRAEAKVGEVTVSHVRVSG
ncbi:hypothetical protein DFJ69_5975 [Thermomonospora umbrina]|uniref:Uncharacterized protein n=2 Tax=Thermomonospora umbrina TaxID=111806 RepID=A0A3D9SX65_9ACTN|nr:hypothetical protein DFJ69_5975 [Thermomonospora umbrina]